MKILSPKNHNTHLSFRHAFYHCLHKFTYVHHHTTIISDPRICYLSLIQSQFVSINLKISISLFHKLPSLHETKTKQTFLLIDFKLYFLLWEEYHYRFSLLSSVKHSLKFGYNNKLFKKLEKISPPFPLRSVTTPLLLQHTRSDFNQDTVRPCNVCVFCAEIGSCIERYFTFLARVRLMEPSCPSVPSAITLVIGLSN